MDKTGENNLPLFCSTFIQNMESNIVTTISMIEKLLEKYLIHTNMMDSKYWKVMLEMLIC